MKNFEEPIDRRTFLKGALAASSLAFIPAGVFGAISQSRRRLGPNDKVNVACIGIGNRGVDITRSMQATGIANIVALCDTEIGGKRTQAILKQFPGVPQFYDFQTMFDKMGREIDAVTVVTPDHSHFPIAMLAMSLGKHVYVEKPLAHSFRQIELMMAAEKRYKVACQMGNQGHSEANYFQFKTWVDAGIVRNVTRITCFMNSPRRWHGMAVSDFLPVEPMEEAVDWNNWIATGTPHPYNGKYLNGDWRSWYDYGNGALGDWGAHIFDTAHEFLRLGLPTEVDPVLIEGHSRFIFPQASTIVFRFPHRGAMPPVELTWYDGVKNRPPLPTNFGGGVVDPNIPPPSSGTLDLKNLPPGKVIYGEYLTFKGGSHATTLEILPNSNALDVKLPEVPKTTSNHSLNFLRACKGDERCRSNFAVAGPLCQAMALGIIAQRLNSRIDFDRQTKRITNHKIANELLNGAPPRKEWEQFYRL